MTRLASLLGKALLRLYPARFRQRFAASMAETLRDRIAAAHRMPRGPRWAALMSILTSLAVAGMKERVRPSYHANGDGRQTGRASLMDRIVQDLTFAVRSLRRRPGFASTALLTLALGIGAITAVFSVVNGVLLRPLPFPDPHELFMVWAHDVDRPDARGWMSLPDLDDVRELSAVAQLEGWQTTSLTFADADQPTRVDVARVTGGLLPVFQLAPLAGRDIHHEENDTGAPRVAVLSHGFWQGQMSGRTDVVGSVIELSERAYEVIGIAPEGFTFPDDVDLWVPYRHSLDGCGRGCSVYRAVGRLSDDQTLPTARPPLSGLASNLSQTYPDTNTDKGMRLELLMDYMVGDVRPGLWTLLGAVALVLLIVCANLANLLLARGSTRRGEVAIRSALGASGPRLVSQILTESTVLAALGGALGIVLSGVFVSGFKRIAPVALPRVEDVTMSPSVLGFTLAVTFAIAILFGLSPALHLVRSSSTSELIRSRRTGHRRQGRARSTLMAAEIAMSVALLVGAGLLTRSLGQLYGQDLGFHGRDVLRFSISLPSSRYDTLPELVSFYNRLEDEIAAVPGVEAVGSAFGSPLGGGSIFGSVLVEGRPEPAPGTEMFARIRPATAGYFDAMGLSMVRGRPLAKTDVTESEPVVVINESFAAQNFPGSDPLGERVGVTASFGWEVSDYWTVVGIVRDIRSNLTGAPIPAMYPPQSQFGPGFLRVHVRGSSSAIAGTMPLVRAKVRALDPNLAIANVETVRDAIRDAAAPTRFYLLMVSLFAGLAVIVAAVGLYGVVAYLASGRTREFGIRMALGAEQPEITTMVLRQGLTPTVWGVIVGVLVSAVGVRWVESLLFGVNPRDPVVFGGVTALIVMVATAASLLPARRAVRIDPTVALRAE